MLPNRLLFRTVSRGILAEPGSSRMVGGLLSEELRRSAPRVAAGAKSTVLFVTDPGVLTAGIAKNCVKSLEEQGFHVDIYSGVLPDPPERCVHEAVAQAKSSGAVAVCGFGGGSSLDVAKLAAFFAHDSCRQELGEVYGVDQCIGDRLPLVQVPTTAGTGSEVTPISILSTGKQEKMGVVSAQLLPDWAVLDGALTLGLPRITTAATGIDAMVHAIEAYTSALKKNTLSDLLAREALRLISANIDLVCNHDPSNAQARTDMLLASTYAGMAFANAPVAAVHALAYPIGSIFNVPHGLSNALMLPHVMKFNMQSQWARECYAELAPIVFPELGNTQSGREDKLVELLCALSERIGVELSLRAVGITEADVPELAKAAMNQTRLLQNNPVEVTLQDAQDLYTQAL